MNDVTADNLVLSARGIGKRFRQGRTHCPVLRGVDLDVPRGQFVAIMGPSGSGKSTLLHILGLMARPTEAARLTIDGTDALGLGPRRQTALRRDKIGFVFQRFNLLGVLSAADNLAMALKLRPVALDHQVDSLLDFVGLTDKRHLRPGQMSIGEQQRLAFARAIICRPAVLLADEPTGNLDSVNADRIMDLIRQTRQTYNQTIIMVTHDRDLADQAGRVCMMKDGELTNGTLD